MNEANEEIQNVLMIVATTAIKNCAVYKIVYALKCWFAFHFVSEQLYHE